MALDDETKLYIKEVVEEAVCDQTSVCFEKEQRIVEIEKKVFNGYGNSIKVLYVLHGVMLGLLIRLAFFRGG